MKQHTSDQVSLLAGSLAIVVAIVASIYILLGNGREGIEVPISCERLLAGAGTSEDTLAAMAEPVCAPDPPSWEY